MKYIRFFLIWIKVIKWEGQCYKNGAPTTCGVHKWNPITWLLVLSLAVAGGVVGFLETFYGVIKDNLFND